jgi:hypothetical protein
MRLTPSDTVDLIDLNRTFRRPSSSHEEGILRRNLPPESFCEDFALAAFSTFSTESANSGSDALLFDHLVSAQQGRPRDRAASN